MINEIKKTAEDKMKKSVDALKTEFGKVRTGRAHPGLLDHVKVDYYGSLMPINQVANVAVLVAHTLGVTPWEKKMGGAIEKAIRDSDLGLNPAGVGDLVRVPIPAMTEERRKELVKVVRHEAEQGKVAVRNIRRESTAFAALRYSTSASGSPRGSRPAVRSTSRRRGWTVSSLCSAVISRFATCSHS